MTKPNKEAAVDYTPSFVFTESDVNELREHVDALSSKILDLIRAAGFKT